MHIIQKALEAVGYEVIVKNEHPDEKPFDYMKPTNPEAWVIHLEADHQPWGG